MSVCAQLPVCADERRRERVRASGTLGGIDYVEVYPDGVTLCVRLFGTVPETLRAGNVAVEGGERITGIQVLEAELEAHEDEGVCLRVTLDRQGDFSTYCLCLVEPQADDATCSFDPFPPEGLAPRVPQGIDPRYACAEFSFRLDCPSPIDCAPAPCPSPLPAPSPTIDYLARDFSGFRQLLLDRLGLTMPYWRERHLPDIGITIVELLAYLGDRLSYQLDANATETYLGTARRRISVRRHARLLDYRMHDGCNARAFVTVAVEGADLPGAALSDLVFAAPAPGDDLAVGGIVAFERLNPAAVVFEPIACSDGETVDLYAAHSTIHFYTWGDADCCLPAGATRATLLDAAPGTEGHAQRTLHLSMGDVLIFEEIRDPTTGAGGADPAKRWPVRLTRIEPAADPLDGTLLVEIEWSQADALPFALCLSSHTAPRAPDGVRVAAGGKVVLPVRAESAPGLPSAAVTIETPPAHGTAEISDDGVLTYAPDPDYTGADVIGLQSTLPDGAQSTSSTTFIVGDGAYCEAVEVAVARGNVVLVDHGLTIEESNDDWLVGILEVAGCCRCEGGAVDIDRLAATFTMTLAQGPITHAAPPPCAPGLPASALCSQDPASAAAEAHLDMAALDPIGGVLGAYPGTFGWQARFDLMESSSEDRHFVVETDDDGFAHLRFGDGDCGLQPPAGAHFRARYRVGNGKLGNVGAEAIRQIAIKGRSLDGITLEPRNPLPATGGTEPETNDEVRRRAPHVYGRVLERAVTADDYAVIAARDARVQAANAELVWDGVGYVAFVALDVLAADAPRAAGARIAAARRIGHDVRLVPALRVPLRIAAHVCADAAYTRSAVTLAVRALLSDRMLPDGTLGLFHPDRLTFGGSVAASQIIAAIQALDGVVHVELTHFARLDDPKEMALARLAAGVIEMAAGEIAQLDNSPDFPERGIFSLQVVGGRP
jgi:hypothetical protein